MHPWKLLSPRSMCCCCNCCWGGIHRVLSETAACGSGPAALNTLGSLKKCVCRRGVLVPAGKTGRKHRWPPLGDREWGPKAAEHPAGITRGACSILGSPAVLLSLMERPHPTTPSFDSLFSPAPNPSLRPALTLPRQTHCRPSCLETHHFCSTGLSVGFPISPPSLCSLNTYPGAPDAPPDFPQHSPCPCFCPPKHCLGPPELQRGRVLYWCERAGIRPRGFAVPSTEMWGS